jgi:hypothetical protein
MNFIILSLSNEEKLKYGYPTIDCPVLSTIRLNLICLLSLTQWSLFLFKNFILKFTYFFQLKLDLFLNFSWCLSQYVHFKEWQKIRYCISSWSFFRIRLNNTSTFGRNESRRLNNDISKKTKRMLLGFIELSSK